MLWYVSVDAVRMGLVSVRVDIIYEVALILIGS